MSQAHSRYARFSHASVLSIPSRMVGVESVFDGSTAERVVSTHRVHRGSTEEPGGASDRLDDEAPAAPQETERACSRELPPNVRHERRVTASGRAYDVYIPPSGPRAYSLAEAWRQYHNDIDEGEGLASHHIASGASDLESDDDEVPPAVVRDVSDLDERLVRGRAEGATATPHASPGVASESLEPSGDSTPSRRPGMRHGRIRVPRNGHHGDEDLASHVVYADRPSSRRAPAARHA
jgi:hypothetical protein